MKKSISTNIYIWREREREREREIDYKVIQRREIYRETKSTLQRFGSHEPSAAYDISDGICPPSHQPDDCSTRPFFKVGPGAGPEPTRARYFQKYLGHRRHYPKGGASGAGQ